MAIISQKNSLKLDLNPFWGSMVQYVGSQSILGIQSAICWIPIHSGDPECNMLDPNPFWGSRVQYVGSPNWIGIQFKEFY